MIQLPRAVIIMTSLAICLVWLFVAAGGPTVVDLAETLQEAGLSLVDLRNSGLLITFPSRNGGWVAYQGTDVEYVYSIVAPDGLSLFAVKRQFNGAAFVDTIIRRSLGRLIGMEEVVVTPFANVFQCAISLNERYLLVAGRLKDPGVPEQERDGIFLFDRRSEGLQFVAPWVDAGMNSSVRSLNVDNRGETVIYEDAGFVVKLVHAHGRFREALRNPGHFPAMLPGQSAYVFADHDWIVGADGQARRGLLRKAGVLGGIRPSPDAKFLAFGVQSDQHTTAPHLDVCELASRRCVAGPKYDEWIPGRETYWMRR